MNEHHLSRWRRSVCLQFDSCVLNCTSNPPSLEDLFLRGTRTCQKLVFRITWTALVVFAACLGVLRRPASVRPYGAARRRAVDRFTRPLLFIPAISTFSRQTEKKTKTKAALQNQQRARRRSPAPTPNGDKLCMFAREKETQSIIQNQYSLWVCAQGGG